MSENLQNFEDFIKNLNDDLDTVDEKYPDEQESDNCAKCLEKLNIYTRYTMALINSNSRDNVESQQSIPSPLCTDGNPKIQDDLNVVRNVLDNRIQLEEQAIDSLLEGKNRKIEF